MIIDLSRPRVDEADIRMTPEERDGILQMMRQHAIVLMEDRDEFSGRRSETPVPIPDESGADGAAFNVQAGIMERRGNFRRTIG